MRKIIFHKDLLSLIKKKKGKALDLGCGESNYSSVLSKNGWQVDLVDSNKKILEYVSMMAFYKYPLDYLETFTNKIDKITTEEIKSAFQRRVDMSKFSTVIVGSE